MHIFLFPTQTPSRRWVNHKLKSSRQKKKKVKLWIFVNDVTESDSVCPRSGIRRPQWRVRRAALSHDEVHEDSQGNSTVTTAMARETETCPQHTSNTALYTSAQQLASQRKRRISCPANTSWELRGPTTVFTAHKDNGKGRCINAMREIGFILVYLGKPGYCSWETCGTAEQSKTCLHAS